VAVEQTARPLRRLRGHCAVVRNGSAEALQREFVGFSGVRAEQRQQRNGQDKGGCP
jgi:hypothetical protein